MGTPISDLGRERAEFVKGAGSARRVDPASDAAGRAPTSDDALALAEEAFWNAEYDECRRLLRFAVVRGKGASAVVALVEARAARLQSDVDAWYLAADRAYREHPESNGRLEGLALRGLANFRRNHHAEAAEDFERLREAVAADPASAVGWPVYYLAFGYWASADYDLAETTINRNLEADVLAPVSLALMGWIDIKRERFKRAATYFLEALRQQKDSGNTNVRLVCTALYAAANAAAETVDLPLGRKLRKMFDEVDWPRSLATDRFNTISCFRFLSLLEGNIDDAWFLSREAAVRAPSPPYGAIGETNAAVVSRLLEDAQSTKLQLERAWELLRKHRWGAADAETRVALTHFAYEAVADMPAEARKAMTMYDSLTERSFPENSLNADRRIAASETMATARIAEAQGDLDRAVRLYRESLSHWNALHFDMRAAMVALDLDRLTRDPAHRDTIAPVLARAPKAWFAHRKRSSIELLPPVTPAEKMVLALLLEGKSARAIAQDLGRSVHTINNHTRKIFKAFGVTSRSAVLARCTAIGVTPSHFGRRS